MAELTTTSSCCTAEHQAGCCGPTEKSSCCGGGPADGACGCSARETTDATVATFDVRETVRSRYAAAARAAAESEPAACACGPISTLDATGAEVFGSALYDELTNEGATKDALAASLGCGVPTAVADLRDGDVVLDLGSGAGADVLLSARRVAPSGRAIGLDMTDEMLELAHRNASRAGVDNVEFVKGYLEQLPLADASIDLVISNCVINLSGDKPRALREAARVLRPGGRFTVSDVIADPDMDDATRADMAQWTGCIAGALTREEFERSLADAGFAEIEIRETHRVHEHAAAAIVRARKPATYERLSAQPASEPSCDGWCSGA